jgi:hypothetical protein
MGLFVTLAIVLWSSLAWAQTPGIWQELPGTAFTASSVFCANPGAPGPPNCLPKSLPNGGNNIPGAAISAWVDGDYDPATGRLIVPRGGGHGDWAGNQVVAFNARTHTWEYLAPYSAAYPPMGTGLPDSAFTPVYPDGSPASVHSYGCQAWMPWLDQFYSGGGIYWNPPGNSTPQSPFWWSPAGGFSLSSWTRKAIRPGGYGCSAIADPATQRVLLRLAGLLTAYNPATDTYTTLFSQAAGGDAFAQSALALDPASRKLYRIAAGTVGALKVADLNSLALKEAILSTEGDTQIQTIAGAGLIWDAGRLVGFGPGPVSGTGALYTLDPARCGLTGQPKCRWQRHVPPDGIDPPRGAVQGIWKKWFRHGCDFYLVGAGTLNVWKIRPAWTTDACAPTPPPRG